MNIRSFTSCLPVTLKAPALLVAVILINACTPSDHAKNELIQAQVVNVGIDSISGSPIVLLREDKGQRIVPIWIGPAEAQAIHMALNGIVPQRPMTHDLLKNLLQETGGSLLHITIHSLESGTYIGSLSVRERNGTIREIDCRPSDAIALALRTRSPIQVSTSLFIEIPEFDLAPKQGGTSDSIQL